MSAWSRFQPHQLENVTQACENAVSEAMSCGMSADELRACLADAWRDQHQSAAERGQKSIAGDLLR